MNRYRILLPLLLLCRPSTAAAQNIFLKGRLLDARTSLPVAGATVEILSLEDTITYRRTTVLDGTFLINPIRSIGRYALLAQKTGYADYLKVIQIKNLVEDLGNIAMVDSARLLKETIVKAKRSAFTVKGDTVEYSSSYYKTIPDMDAVYLLSKMPGIDVINMKANGDSVSGIAINGLVIFGSRPQQILAQLPAGLVERVQVYTDSAAGPGARTKIINVKTADGALRRPTGNALAGAGPGGVATAGANAIRQVGGAQSSAELRVARGGIRNAAYYDPSLLYESVGFPLDGSFSLNLTQPLSPRDGLNIDYRAHASRNRIIRTSLDQFSLPGSAEYSFIRTHADGKQQRLANNLGGRWVRKLASGAQIQVQSNLGTNASRSADSVDVFSSIAGAVSTARAILQPMARAPSGNASVRYASRGGKASGYTGSLGYSHTAADLTTNAAGFNSNASAVVANNFQTEAVRRAHNFNLNLGGRHARTARHTLIWTASAAYGLNRATQRRDFFSESTQAYSLRDSLFSTSADYAVLNGYAEPKSVWTLDSGRTTIEAGVGAQCYAIRERSGAFGRSYFTAAPFLRYTRRYSTQRELGLELEQRAELPTYADLNPVLIAESPYLYRAGTLALQPAQRLSAGVSYRGKFLLNGSLFNTRAGGIFLRRNIVQSQILPGPGMYFFDGKPIPIGAQVLYTQNFGTYRYGYANFAFDAPLPALKVVLKFRNDASAMSTESLLNETPVNTTTYRYAASSTVSSTISTRLDFVAYAAYNFNRTVQSGGGAQAARDLHRWMINSLLTAQVDKRQTLKAEANINYTTGLALSGRTRFYLLDLSYSAKVLRSQKLSLGATLHDAFNSYRAFGFERSTFDGATYRINSIHSYETNAVGRYGLFTAGYAF